MNANGKYYLICDKCKNRVDEDSFRAWFWNGQQCRNCGERRVSVHYFELEKQLPKLITKTNLKRVGIWRYFPLLPVLSECNIVTGGEGNALVERWNFLEVIARERHNVKCQVYAHRQDMNPATGSFKDLAGTVLASVLKENGVRNYVASSTGNIGVAFSRYLSSANINLYVFLPENTSSFKEAEIACFGQQVFKTKGNYSFAKALAKKFSEDNGFLLSGGTFDPSRIEAKKTMAFEWKRCLPIFPNVYVQALSGGTGPLGVYKGCSELKSCGIIDALPKLVLVQTSGCAPMADAWSQSEAMSFPKKWEELYPKYDEIPTKIGTLATGNPDSYPILAPLVRENGGTILTYPELAVSHIATLTALETSVRIGPAAAVAVGGFLVALAKNIIHENDVVVINIGEGVRREPEFMKSFTYYSRVISDVADCRLKARSEIKQDIYSSMLNFIYSSIGAVK